MTHTLTAYQQEQLNRLTAADCIGNTQLNPIARGALHKLRELKLVDFRAGRDDFEWFVVPQETETQEAPAAVVALDDEPFTPRKGMRVEFQKAFDKSQAWLTGMYWGVYAGNPKLHMVRHGGISEPAWNVRSLAGEPAKLPALEGQIVKGIKPLAERVASIRDTNLREVAAALFDISLPVPTPVTVPSNGAIEDAVYVELEPQAESVATCDFCEERPRMAQSQYCETCARQIVGYFTEAQVTHWMDEIKERSGILIPPAPEQVVDIFNGMADFDPRPQATERTPLKLFKLNIHYTAFKQVKGGVILSTAKVFSRKSPWSGQGWIVGRWSDLLALALMPDGTLLLLDGAVACEVRSRKVETLDALFTAWAGVDWNARLKARV